MVFARLFSHQVEGDFSVGPRIKHDTRGHGKTRSATWPKSCGWPIWPICTTSAIAAPPGEAIRTAASPISDRAHSPEAAARFLSLLIVPAGSASCCTNCTRWACSKRSSPPLPTPAACCNSTSITSTRSTNIVCGPSRRPRDSSTTRVRSARSIGAFRNKRLLHLALLIHDLGKGYRRRSQRSRAADCRRNGPAAAAAAGDAEALKFLVHKHLLMSHLAFRRDTSDDQLIVRFAVEVGSPEVLRMLFVLTRRRPGRRGAGRAERLEERGARRPLSTARCGIWRAISPSASGSMSGGQTCSRLRPATSPSRWFAQQIDALPSFALFSMPPERIAEQLRQLHDADRPGEVAVAARYLAETGTVEYIIGTHEDITPGVFHKLTGGPHQPGPGDPLGRDQHAGRRADARPILRPRPDYSGEPPPRSNRRRLIAGSTSRLAGEHAAGLPQGLAAAQAAAPRCR